MMKAPLGRKPPGAIPRVGASGGRSPGAKRSVLMDSRGVPLGITVASANRHDVMLLAATLASIPVARPRLTTRTPQGVCPDMAYEIT